MTYMDIIKDVLGFFISLYEEIMKLFKSVTVKHGYEMDEFQPDYVESTTL